MWFKVVRGTNIGYRLFFISVLNFIKAGLYKVKRRISSFTYELEFLKEIKMHLVIFIIYLEPV